MEITLDSEIYKAIVETAGHELYVATYSFQEFDRNKSLLVSKQEEEIKRACYISFSNFLRSLYEFYIAIIKIDFGNTKLPKSITIDEKINNAVQRLLNFYGPYYASKGLSIPSEVPPFFGRDFRNVRNRISHADYRRMFPELGSDETSLAEFYEKYWLYVRLLFEHPQFNWGGMHFENSYRWDKIDCFVSVVMK